MLFRSGCFSSVCGGGLCVSCLGNPQSVGVLSSLAGRNVQRRLLQQCMCGWPCVSCLGNPKSVGVLSSLARRNVSINQSINFLHNMAVQQQGHVAGQLRANVMSLALLIICSTQWEQQTIMHQTNPTKYIPHMMKEV